MIAVEDWAEIRRLHRAEGLPIRQIARVLGISRNTVKAALKSERPPRYERRPAGSVADGGRAADQGAAGGVPADAVDGDRGADRLAEPAGKRGPPGLRGESRLREVHPDKALEEQEAQEGPQPGDEVLRSGGRHRG